MVPHVGELMEITIFIKHFNSIYLFITSILFQILEHLHANINDNRTTNIHILISLWKSWSISNFVTICLHMLWTCHVDYACNICLSFWVGSHKLLLAFSKAYIRRKGAIFLKHSKRKQYWNEQLCPSARNQFI